MFPGLALKRLDHSESLLNVHLRKFLEKEGRYDLKHRVQVLLGQVKKIITCQIAMVVEVKTLWPRLSSSNFPTGFPSRTSGVKTTPPKIGSANKKKLFYVLIV